MLASRSRLGTGGLVLLAFAIALAWQPLAPLTADEPKASTDSAADKGAGKDAAQDSSTEDATSENDASSDAKDGKKKPSKKREEGNAKKKKTTRQPARGQKAMPGNKAGAGIGGPGGGTTGAGSSRTGTNAPAKAPAENSSDQPAADNGGDKATGAIGSLGSKPAPPRANEGPDSELVQKVMDIQNKHTESLIKTKGILGTATALDSKGRVVVKVFTDGSNDAKIPEKLDGIPVDVELTGAIQPEDGFAGSAQYNPKLRATRPIPIGISAAPVNSSCVPSLGCYSGTLGCRLKSKDGTKYYALSNNHVFANENATPLNTQITQPSSGELAIFCKCVAENEIGPLVRFKEMKFGFSGINRIDAAIIEVDPEVVGNSTLADGYGTPRTYTYRKPFLGQALMKYGRTTGFTKGHVVAVNVFIGVAYSSGVGFFSGQVAYTGNGGLFNAGGDSGSLVVDKDRFPVALHYAGGGGFGFGNPIQEILDEFGLVIDGDDSQDFDIPGKVGKSQPNQPK